MKLTGLFGRCSQIIFRRKTAVIAIENLSMRFGEETRIVYEDFVFEDARSYVILGPSGC